MSQPSDKNQLANISIQTIIHHPLFTNTMITLSDFSLSTQQNQSGSTLNGQIQPRDIVYIHGHSQSGKSTLAHYLADPPQLKKHSGTLSISAKITLCPQDIHSAFCHSVNIGTYLNTCLPKLENLTSDLSALKLPNSILQHFPNQLSTGQLKRLAVLLSLYAPSDVVIFDETFSSLDPSTLSHTLQWVLQRQQTKALIIITHTLLPHIKATTSFHLSPAALAPQATQAPSIPKTQEILSIQNLEVNYPGKKIILDHLRLNVGTCSALTGPSGCGKTSVIKTVLDIVPYQGQIIRPANSHIQWVCQDSYAAFSPFIPIRQAMGMSDICPITLKNMTQAIAINPFTHQLPTELSGGCLQVLQIMRALARKPNILILDEPTNAMDTNLRRATISLLKEWMLQKQLSIILISHDTAMIHELALQTFTPYIR